MNKLKRKQNERPQAFWGALIGAGTSLVGGLLGNNAAKKQARLMANQNDYNIALQDAQSATNAYNAALDYQQNYLQQFKQQARFGGIKRLGGRNIMITDGGNAKRIGNNTYLLRGGSHEDINETGQTGIGINVGGNEIEAEGGEVAQRKGNSLRIYSAQPILGGISPAEAIMRGYNKDKVFAAQQQFKKRNGLKDDGSKAQWGMGVGTNRALQKSTKNGTRSIRSMWNSAKGPLSYTPIVGTAIDGYNLINNPSKTNIVNFGVGLISDLLGYKWLKQTFATPVRRTVNLAHRRRIPANVSAGIYSGSAKVIDTELNYLQNKKRLGCRVKARIGTEKTYEDENKTNIITSNLNGAEYLSKIISGAIMQGGRLLTGHSKDRGPVNNVAQDTYLMPFRLGQGRAFKDAGYDRDYQSEKKRDYGLVQKAVGNENIPIYSRVNNPEKRKELIQIYNPESTYNPNIKYPLIHAAFHPSSLYIDGTNGNVMYKGWDLNDYGTDKGGKGFSSYYGSIRKALANTLDVFGYPTVVTTGYQNILDKNGKPMNIFKGNYKDDFNANIAVSDFIVKQLLKKENPSFVNEYGMSPISEVVITAPRKKHKLGGLTSKDRDSSKYPYPSVSSKDFAGGGRSYPIPTKADAVDALRLAGLHGRNDIRSKVYSKYPELRKKAKRIGGIINPPVESFKCGGRIRPKAENGMLAPIYSYGSDRRRLPSFAPIDITPRAIPNFKPISVPTNTKTPFDPNSVPFLGNQSTFKPATQDYIGLGIDTLAALGSGLINYNSASKTYIPERTSIIQSSKLPTYYNISPQIEEIRRQRNKAFDNISHNTSSSVAAINRMNRIASDSALGIDKLYATKENKENKMLTQDALNQQSVAAENTKLQADYEANKANILNAQNQAKADAINLSLSGLSQAWTNFAGSIENRYDNRQKEAIIAATAKDPAVLSNAVQFGYNFSPEVLAAIYNSTDDDNLKSLALSQLSTKNRLRYGIR